MYLLLWKFTTIQLREFIQKCPNTRYNEYDVWHDSSVSGTNRGYQPFTFNVYLVYDVMRTYTFNGWPVKGFNVTVAMSRKGCWVGGGGIAVGGRIEGSRKLNATDRRLTRPCGARNLQCRADHPSGQNRRGR